MAGDQCSVKARVNDVLSLDLKRDRGRELLTRIACGSEFQTNDSHYHYGTKAKTTAKIDTAIDFTTEPKTLTDSHIFVIIIVPHRSCSRGQFFPALRGTALSAQVLNGVALWSNLKTYQFHQTGSSFLLGRRVNNVLNSH